MPKVNCDVVGCSSSTYRINKRKKEPFLEHVDKNVVKGQFPNCERPYTVFQLRWQKTKRERDAWIQAFKRENPSRTKWNLTSSDRICSLHFVDGIPTNANPYSNHAYGLRYNKK